MSTHPAFVAKGVSRDAANARRDNRIIELEHAVHALDSLRSEVASLKEIIQGIADLNKNTGQYVEWLRERAAARQGAKK